MGTNHTYGAIKQPFDHRDFKLSALHLPTANTTTIYDLRAHMPSICDQGPLGSCTSFGSGSVFHYLLTLNNVAGEKFEPAHLFIYLNSRLLDSPGDPQAQFEDRGATVRSAIKSLRNFGAPAEHEWPYDVSKFTQRPPQSVYDHASHREAVQYYAVNQDVQSIRTCLAQQLPVVIGFEVFESFETSTVDITGEVPMPSKTEQSLGGHCVSIVGHNPFTKKFQLRNSWGPSWGLHGYFEMPEAYIEDQNLSWDFWCMSVVKRVA